MKVIRKTVNVLLLTPEEVSNFRVMLQEASEGKTVHASERKQADGSYFGISISAEHAIKPPVKCDCRAFGYKIGENPACPAHGLSKQRV